MKCFKPALHLALEPLLTLALLAPQLHVHLCVAPLLHCDGARRRRRASCACRRRGELGRRGGSGGGKAGGVGAGVGVGVGVGI